ncbi:MAG: ABC transporter substrate-binding protein, partial [Anaerolineae bacterium]
MSKLVRFLIPLLVLSIVLAGCGPAATPTPTPIPPTPTKPPAPPAPTPVPPKPKAITVQEGANDPKSIDPQRAVDARDAELETHLFPSLIVPNVETNEIMPGMAKSWEVSPDGLVYTFHLLEKVPWVWYNPDTKAVEQVKDKDGNVRYVTAKDFVYGFLRALDPQTASTEAYVLAPYIVG